MEKQWVSKFPSAEGQYMQGSASTGFWDKSELRDLCLDWSLSQEFLQLTSSVDPFHLDMEQWYYTLFSLSSFLLVAMSFFSFIHTFLRIVSTSGFWLWHLDDWRLSCLKRPWGRQVFPCLWPSIQIIIWFFASLSLLAAPSSMKVLSCPTRNRTYTQFRGSAGLPPLDHQESPGIRWFQAGMWSQLAPLVFPSSPFHLFLCTSSTFRFFSGVPANMCPLGMYPKTIAS